MWDTSPLRRAAAAYPTPHLPSARGAMAKRWILLCTWLGASALACSWPAGMSLVLLVLHFPFSVEQLIYVWVQTLRCAGLGRARGQRSFCCHFAYLGKIRVNEMCLVQPMALLWRFLTLFTHGICIIHIDLNMYNSYWHRAHCQRLLFCEDISHL